MLNDRLLQFVNIDLHDVKVINGGINASGYVPSKHGW